MFIAGSHRFGVLHHSVRSERPTGYTDEPEYISNLMAELRYTISLSNLRELASSGELVAPKGPAGTVLVLHPNLVHASGPNLSVFDRRLIIVSYNSIHMYRRGSALRQNSCARPNQRRWSPSSTTS
jgi:ectoine hydroxylase